MATEITPEDIAEAAKNPQSVTTDGTSASAHSIPDQIAAAQFAASQAALTGSSPNGGPKSAWHCLRIARSRPGGAV
jgi:hypothetical protein